MSSTLRALALAAALALLAGCATEPPAAAPDPTPSVEPAPTESAGPLMAAAGQPRVPADCGELLGAARDELEIADASTPFYRGAWWLARLQAGVLVCAFDSASGDRVSIVAVAEPSTEFAENFSADPWESREFEGGRLGIACPELEPGIPNYCTVRIVVGPYGVELIAVPSADRAQLRARSDLIADAIAAFLGELPAPLVAWKQDAPSATWPTACNSIDLSTSAAASALPVLAHPPREGGYFAEDLMLVLLSTEPAITNLRCDWSARGPDYVGARLEIVHGGSWALGDDSALPTGSALTVTGADDARAFSPEFPGGVVVAAAVGPDLVLVHVFPSETLATGDEQQRAATQLLAEVLATYP